MRRSVVLLGSFVAACASSGPIGPIPPPTTASVSSADAVATSPTSTSSSTTAEMTTFEDKGYVLSGAEYWPYKGTEDARYPEDVLWGFYPKKGVTPPGETDPNPDDASPSAIACAKKSYAALRAFVASDPPELRRIVEKGASLGYTHKFYLWTNDYTHAADPFPPGVRPARLWYWKRKTPDPARPPGYWKWEATLTRSGECQIPTADQIRAVLAENVAKLPP
jgi:hypothetical protein